MIEAIFNMMLVLEATEDFSQILQGFTNKYGGFNELIQHSFSDPKIA